MSTVLCSVAGDTGGKGRCMEHYSLDPGPRGRQGSTSGTKVLGLPVLKGRQVKNLDLKNEANRVYSEQFNSFFSNFVVQSLSEVLSKIVVRIIHNVTRQPCADLARRTRTGTASRTPSGSPWRFSSNQGKAMHRVGRKRLMSSVRRRYIKQK
jgi:hypothetical protein